MERTEIAGLILEKLRTEKSSIKQSYLDTKGSIGCFFVDDLLPEDIALAIYRAFPPADAMKLNKSLRECKYIA
jgi:hypothetical protein